MYTYPKNPENLLSTDHRTFSDLKTIPPTHRFPLCVSKWMNLETNTKFAWAACAWWRLHLETQDIISGGHTVANHSMSSPDQSLQLSINHRPSISWPITSRIPPVPSEILRHDIQLLTSTLILVVRAYTCLIKHTEQGDVILIHTRTSYYSCIQLGIIQDNSLLRSYTSMYAYGHQKPLTVIFLVHQVCFYRAHVRDSHPYSLLHHSLRSRMLHMRVKRDNP